MSLRDNLSDIRDWLQTWSGRLAAIAAGVTGIIGAIPADWAGVVVSVLPDGWLRIVLAVSVAALVLLLPKKAQDKDITG